jgi:nitrogen fixation protein FixH
MMLSPKTRWTIGIVGLLGLSVLINAIMLVVAVSDPSFAVEAGYEQKARNYDAYKQELRASEALGWTATLTTKTLARYDVQVTLQLRDISDQPIEGAVVELSAFHNARAANKLSPDLVEEAPGTYVGRAPMRSSGIWVFDVVATQDEARYIDTIKKIVNVRP